MRRTLAALALASLCTLALAARDPLDAQGAAEPPGMPRFPGFHIDDSQRQDFRAFRFMTPRSLDDPDAGDAKEGPYWFADYVLNDGARQPSALELVRNHENAARKAGGALVFRGPVSGGRQSAVYRLPRPEGGERWMQIDIQNDGWRYQVHVVDAGAMVQKLEFSAGQMRDTLREGGHVTLRGILFETGQARIRPESAPLLDEVVALLRQNGALKLVVEGHTDNVGTSPANLELSRRRAQAVVQYLSGQGIAAARLRAEGRGDTEPVADNRSEQGRAQNRRVVLSRL